MPDEIIVTADTTPLTRCYGFLIVGMPLTFMPVGPWAVLGMVSLLIGVIWAYVLRKRDNPSELVATHARWMVRTFWISSLFSIVAIALAGITVSANADNAALADLTRLAEGGATPDPEQARALAEQFQMDNAGLLMWATIGYLAVPILFAVARFVKGWRLARRGRPIADVTTWSV